MTERFGMSLLYFSVSATAGFKKANNIAIRSYILFFKVMAMAAKMIQVLSHSPCLLAFNFSPEFCNTMVVCSIMFISKMNAEYTPEILLESNGLCSIWKCAHLSRRKTKNPWEQCAITVPFYVMAKRCIVTVHNHFLSDQNRFQMYSQE